MSKPLTRVIIAGASGILGTAIVTALVSDPRFNVSVLSRASSEATFPEGFKVHRLPEPYAEAELVEVFRGADVVVSCVATMHVLSQKLLASAAAKAGVCRFVASEFGNDNTNTAAAAVLPQYSAGKLAVVEHLRGLERDGLSWSAFVTGPFFEMSMVSGFLGFDIAARRARIVGQGDVAWSTTMMADVALAVKNALLRPEETANRYLFINSFAPTQKRLLAAFEAATGGEWETEATEPEAERKQGDDLVAAGDFGAGVSHLIRYLHFVKGFGGNSAEDRGTANELLGLPRRDLDEEVTNMVKGVDGAGKP